MGSRLAIACLGTAQAHHLDLQAQDLLVSQALASLKHLRAVLGKVNLAQGRLLADEPMLEPQGDGKRVAHIRRLLKRVCDEAAHPRCRDALGSRVHGEHLDKARLLLTRLAQEGDVRIGHALEPVLERDLPRKRDAHTTLELGSHPGLPEPGGDDDARTVEDGHFEDMQASARLFLDNLIDRAHNGHKRTDGSAGGCLDVGKVYVAAWVVLEQSPHR